MSTTLGGATLADPAAADGCRKQVVDVGGEEVMADGSRRVDYIGTRRRWDLKWRGISSAQVATIYTKYLIRSVQVFSPPDTASTYNVIVVSDSWRENPQKVPSGFIYEVDMAVEEQAVS